MACAITHPLQFLFMLRGRLIALVIAACVIAISVHTLANTLFQAKTAQRRTGATSFVFLFVALVVIEVLFRVADRFVSDVLGTERFLPSATVAYTLLALELLWIAVLDRVL